MQRTYKCPCSVRALEVFVRDFTGLEVRQRCSNVRIRHLSTRPALAIRSSASQNLVTQSLSPARNLDDTFVPFDFSLENKSLGRIQDLSLHKPATLHSSEASQIPLKLEDAEEVEDLEEFEPELVIHGDQTSNTADLSPAVESTNPETSLSSRSIDALGFPDLHTRRHSETQNATDTQRLDMILPERSRVDRRKERKIRRQEAKKQELEEAKAQEEAVKAAEKRQARKERRKLKYFNGEMAAPTTATTTVAAAAAAAAAPPPPTRTASKSKSPKPEKLSKTEKTTKPSKKPEEKEEENPTLKYPRKEKEPWQIQKAALFSKFGPQETWNPRKRISPDALSGIRALHAKSPETVTTPVLSEYFKVAPEAIRRILKSKWQPSEDEVEERRHRWEKRGLRKWEEMAKEGIKPPKRWRDLGAGRAGEGEKPMWKRAGVKGERWVEESRAEDFVVAGEVAREEVDEVGTGDDIVDRIL